MDSENEDNLENEDNEEFDDEGEFGEDEQPKIIKMSEFEETDIEEGDFDFAEEADQE